MPPIRKIHAFVIRCAVTSVAVALFADVSAAKGVKGGGGAGGGKRVEPPTVTVPDADPAAAQQAQQELTTARAERKKAEDNLASVVARLREEFEKSPEMAKALADLKAAQAQYDVTAKPALARVHETAEYKALRAAKGGDEAKITELQGQSDTGDQIALLAQDAMKQGAAQTKLENDSLAQDPAALGAKAGIATAGGTIGKLRGQFNATLPQNADWLAAKKSLDDAVQKLQVADASSHDAASKLASAQAAHDAAQAQKDKLAKEYANQRPAAKKTDTPADPTKNQ